VSEVNKSVTPVQLLLAITTILPFVLQFYLTGWLYGIWAIHKQPEQALMLAVECGLLYGIFAGALFPIVSLWKKELTHDRLRLISVILLTIGLILAFLLWKHLLNVVSIASSNPPGSTEYYNMLGNVFMSTYFAVILLSFALCSTIITLPHFMQKRKTLAHSSVKSSQ